MLQRLPGAIVRAIMVVILIVLPYVLLPSSLNDSGVMTILIALFAAIFTAVEYTAKSPSIVEFRDAPPFNRVRFSALFATVLCLAIIFRGAEIPSFVSDAFRASGTAIGQTIDFPYSPVRLMVLMMPDDTDPAVILRLRDAAGLSYLVSVLSVIWFVVMLRFYRWPRRTGEFNVWINLPTFDPTSAGDVVERLERDARVNIILGFLLPFVIPAVMKLVATFGTHIVLDSPQTLIWTVTAWAFLPASILMRGVAISRVAQMIALQRKQSGERGAPSGQPSPA